MNAELLTCPFCGCFSEIAEDPRCFRDGVGYRVECAGDCHAMTCWWHSVEQAVAAWNRRKLKEGE